MTNIETINIALLSIISLTNIVLAVLVILYGKSGRAPKWFAGVIFSTVAWTLVNYLADNIQNHYWSLIWTKMTFSTTAMLAWFLLLFALEYGRRARLRRVLILATFVPNLIIQTLMFTRLIVKDVERYERGVNVIFGGFDWVFAVIFFGFLFLSIGLLIRRYRRTKENEYRYEILFMLLGLSLFVIAGAITNFIIPVVFNYFYASVFGPYFSIFFIGLTTYAILRHKALGINILAPQVFTLFIGAVLLVEVIIASDMTQRFIRSVIFLWYVVLAVLLIRAIRHEASLVQMLSEANKNLKQLMDIKNEFMQIASHQLRTPVSVMRGMLDMLREDDGRLTETQKKEFIEKAYLKSEKLVQIIADVLSATEMDVPDFNIAGTAKQLDLADLAKKSANVCRSQAKQKGLRFSVHTKKAQVSGSEVYLPQAMINLIDNAVKYTQSGSVRVEVHVEGDDAVFQVRDTGAGVPEDEIKELWTKFKRATNARDLHTDGSGLGLFIVKKIIEGHAGGRVFVTSKLDKGSTFGFRLPLIYDKK